MASRIDYVHVPNVDYPSLLAAYQAPDYQTPQGRMALARYWVEAFQIEPMPGFVCDRQDPRYRSIAVNCREELSIALEEHQQALINHKCDKEFRSYPCWLRTAINVMWAVSKPFRAIMDALDRVLPEGRAGEYILYGAGLLFFSGGFYFVARKNPPLALVIGTGLGAVAGTALLCTGIYLAIKQKYYQGRQ